MKITPIISACCIYCGQGNTDSKAETPNGVNHYHARCATGFGFITQCPVCGSKDLKNESGFLVEGVSCNTCHWQDIDGGVDSGC